MWESELSLMDLFLQIVRRTTPEIREETRGEEKSRTRDQKRRDSVGVAAGRFTRGLGVLSKWGQKI